MAIVKHFIQIFARGYKIEDQMKIKVTILSRDYPTKRFWVQIEKCALNYETVPINFLITTNRPANLISINAL